MIKVEKYDYNQEKELWFETYLNYNDHNLSHAYCAFISNGYDVENQENAKKMHKRRLEIKKRYGIIE